MNLKRSNSTAPQLLKKANKKRKSKKTTPNKEKEKAFLVIDGGYL